MTLVTSTKCETLNIRDISEVHFGDGTKIDQMNESRYLGCFLNSKTNAHREISKRKGDVFATWQTQRILEKTTTAAWNLNS